jgi:hypothetical protein
VRADFYDPLIGNQDIRALLPTRQVLLASMPRPELERTIVEPAKKVELAFDPPSLVQRILDEAGEDEGMLPLLQYALKESWALRKHSKITADSYARSGGVREAIKNTAEQTFEALSTEDQQAARQLFLRLVTPGEGQEDTRARAAMPVDLTQRKIVEKFAGPRTRLLVTGRDRAARPTVEVAHEALIRTWPRLRGWINANREKLRARTAVLQAKTEWEQQARREDLLLPAGFQLERARALLAEPGDLNMDDIKEFIALSSAREKRRQRITRWAAAVGTVILIAGVTVAYLQVVRQCYAIETNHQELYGPDGDTLQFGARRDCEHGQAIGFEFFNFGKVKFNEQATPIDLVSAGIFIKETARNVQAPDRWHEFTVFKQANNFPWITRGPAFQDIFLKDGCGFDRADIPMWDKAETRQGLLLRSEGMRSNPRLERGDWLRCNYGFTPDQPDYKKCDYVYLEFFIPTIAPERWCAKSNLWDKWFGPGTRKITFPPIGSYDELRILAQDRWVESRAKPASEVRWNGLSKGMPKICMRWIGPQDEVLGELSRWQEFASIAAIWCDN